MKIQVNIQGKSFKVGLNDLQARPIRAEIEGEIFEVWPEETPVQARIVNANTAAPLPPSSPPAVATRSTPIAQEKRSNIINAPIPGVIVAINVKQGDTVQYGQELCILEAMKMKNTIRANRDGIVKEVYAQLNEHVQQGKALIELEEDR